MTMVQELEHLHHLDEHAKTDHMIIFISSLQMVKEHEIIQISLIHWLSSFHLASRAAPQARSLVCMSLNAVSLFHYCGDKHDLTAFGWPWPKELLSLVQFMLGWTTCSVILPATVDPFSSQWCIVQKAISWTLSINRHSPQSCYNQNVAQMLPL